MTYFFLNLNWNFRYLSWLRHYHTGKFMILEQCYHCANTGTFFLNLPPPPTNSIRVINSAIHLRLIPFYLNSVLSLFSSPPSMTLAMKKKARQSRVYMDTLIFLSRTNRCQKRWYCMPKKSCPISYYKYGKKKLFFYP